MRVKLRSLKEDDIWKLHKWINDPEIIKFTNYYRPISEMEQRKWFNSIPEISNNNSIFGIELLENNELIGFCGLHDINYIHSRAELRIKIGESRYWNQGYGKEALLSLIDHGFNDLNLHRIWLTVIYSNVNAIKLYEKLGFKKEGTLKDNMFIKGEYVDTIVMGLIREK